MHKYLDFAIKYNYTFVMCKYTLQQILGSEQESVMGKKFLASSTMRDLCAVFGREDEMAERQVRVKNKSFFDKAPSFEASEAHRYLNNRLDIFHARGGG